MTEDFDVSRIYDESPEDGMCQPSEDYVRSSGRKEKVTLLVILLTAVIALAVMLLGDLRYPLDEIFGKLVTFDSTGDYGKIVWLIQMPMIVIAILVGAALSLSGTVMQCILKNPLASPYTLGISGAASFGAAFAIVVLNSGSLSAPAGSIIEEYSIVICAFLFAMLSVGLILLLVKLTNVSAETMVLAGVAVSALFTAGLTLMQYFADSNQLSAIVSWSFGNLNSSNWTWDCIVLLILALIGAYFMFNRWNLNAMDAGDEVAKGLGVNTERFRTVSLILTAFLSAVVVSKFGVIAFVGLIGPHIARMIVGSDHRFLIPMSMVIGACILLIANCIAVNVMWPMVLPVGLLTSLLGAPMFIALLIRRYGS